MIVRGITHTDKYRTQIPETVAIRVGSAIEELVEALEKAPRLQDPSLAGGLSGYALFLAYHMRQKKERYVSANLQPLLEEAIQKADMIMHPALFGGLPGLAWVLEHLQGWAIPQEGNGEDPHEDLDQYLLNLLEKVPWTRDYDLISGLVGWGVYALERMPKRSSHRLLERILDHLEILAIQRVRGLSWKTPTELLPEWQRKVAPHGYYNLGLAHGVPGVLVLLAAMHAWDIHRDRVLRLLEGGVDWLISMLSHTEHGVILPMFCPAELEAPPQVSSNIAWCYGELGAGAALLIVGEILGRQDWQTTAMEMLLSAARRPIDMSGVRDGGLCHGAAGNTHIFHRVFRMTGHPAFQEACFAYLDQLFQIRMPGRDIGGWPSFDTRTPLEAPEQDPWRANSELLEGAGGIALALTSLLDTEEPAWDRFMMLSIRKPN